MNAKFVLRMTAPMIAISLLLLALGVGSAWYVHSLQKENSDLLALDVSSMLAAEDIVIKMREVRSRLSRYLREHNPQQLEALPALRQETGDLLAAVRQTAGSERELNYVAEIDMGCHRFFDDIEAARKTASPEEAILRLINDTGIEKNVFEPAREFVDYHRKIVEATGKEGQVMADRMGTVLALLGACGSAAGLLAGFGIARGISRSIVQLSVPVHGAAGKLNEVVGPIMLSAPANFKELETTLQAMADHIATVVERLEQREREVLRSEQLAAVGQLAAGIAHELRNPLMAIKILVQSTGDRGGALQGRDLSVVEEEIGRLEGSIQALLDFARPPEPAKQKVDLRQVIGQTVDLVSARAEQQHISLVSHTPAQPAYVEADGGQIRQVLLNLLFNSFDALPNGGLVGLDVVITSHGSGLAPTNSDGQAEDELADGGYMIRVADNGSGLPSELGERIFEPFISTKETGTGLGLPICRRIIEAHGGQITATNGPQGGAEFTIWLPRAGRPAAQPLVAAAPVEPFSLNALVAHAAPARHR